MKTAECEGVFYHGSTYVWCKGESGILGRHPIFVSSPVRLTPGPNGRYTLQKCRHASCVALRSQGGHQQRIIAIDYGTTNSVVSLDIYDDGQLFWVVREY